jgi:hypothetical protein
MFLKASAWHVHIKYRVKYEFDKKILVKIALSLLQIEHKTIAENQLSLYDLTLKFAFLIFSELMVG